MVNSKIVKILCYTLITLSCFAGITLLIMGISSFNDNSYSIIFLIVSIALPLTTIIITYPLFALASIDKNTDDINKKFDRVIDLLTKTPVNKVKRSYTSCNCNDDTDNLYKNPTNTKIVTEKSLPESSLKQESRESIRESVQSSTPSVYTDEIENIISFINNFYKTNLSSADSYDILKEKIEKISNYQAKVLKEKIVSAFTKEEIFATLKMHKVLISLKDDDFYL